MSSSLDPLFLVFFWISRSSQFLWQLRAAVSNAFPDLYLYRYIAGTHTGYVPTGLRLTDFVPFTIVFSITHYTLVGMHHVDYNTVNLLWKRRLLLPALRLWCQGLLLTNKYKKRTTIIYYLSSPWIGLCLLIERAARSVFLMPFSPCVIYGGD